GSCLARLENVQLGHCPEQCTPEGGHSGPPEEHGKGACHEIAVREYAGGPSGRNGPARRVGADADALSARRARRLAASRRLAWVISWLGAGSEPARQPRWARCPPCARLVV